MPVFTINTNIKEVKPTFHDDIVEVLARTLNKPKSYIAVNLNLNQSLTFGGSSRPAALCDLGSIGQIDREKNKQHSKVIMEFLKTYDIPSDRIYINFVNLDKAFVGYNATTFDDFM